MLPWLKQSTSEDCFAPDSPWLCTHTFVSGVAICSHLPHGRAAECFEVLHNVWEDLSSEQLAAWKAAMLVGAMRRALCAWLRHLARTRRKRDVLEYQQSAIR